MMNAIVEEADSYGDYAATTKTSGYRVVGDKAPMVKQGLLDCPQDAVDSRFAAINRDTNKGFVRAMDSEKTRSLNPSTSTIGPAWSPGTFQPPDQCQDCMLGVASQTWSFRNITPTSLEVCHGLHKLLYGLPGAAGHARLASRGRVARRGQDGLLGELGEGHSW